MCICMRIECELCNLTTCFSFLFPVECVLIKRPCEHLFFLASYCCSLFSSLYVVVLIFVVLYNNLTKIESKKPTRTNTLFQRKWRAIWRGKDQNSVVQRIKNSACQWRGKTTKLVTKTCNLQAKKATVQKIHSECNGNSSNVQHWDVKSTAWTMLAHQGTTQTHNFLWSTL